MISTVITGLLTLFTFNQISHAQSYVIGYGNGIPTYYVTQLNATAQNGTNSYTIVRNSDGSFRVIPSSIGVNYSVIIQRSNIGFYHLNQNYTPISMPTVSTPSPSAANPPASQPSATPSPASPGETSTSPQTNGDYALSQDEMTMVNYVNEERTKVGLKPLAIDYQLAKVARLKAQDMKDNNYFSHTSPTYGSPFEMMKSFGITYRTAGENIAKNSSVLKAHLAFMNSEGHRANILNATFTNIGVGIVDYAGGKIVVEMFIGK